MKATNIEYDVENEKVKNLLPKEIQIPDWVDEDGVGDYISDVTGFCHYGFVLEDE